MQYPSKEDYVKAVQHRDAFSAELKRAEFVLDRVWQIPKPAAGTSAVVFQAAIDDEAQALRFFTRNDASSKYRYDALREHFTSRNLASCVAMSHWIDNGIRVNGRAWPVLRMQWVTGSALNRHVEELVRKGDTRGLASLADAWRQLVLRLQLAEFAHGDLQHGNVLVDDSGVLRLVDFDCSWISRFAGQPAPNENGHRNYQPEHRPWGRWMDTFSGLVIYTSLFALSRNPNPWYALNTGENLLFRQEDFRLPYQTPTWMHLSSIGDPQVDQLAARLKECCATGWSASGGMNELLAPRELAWWERTGKPVAASPASGPTPASPPMPPMPPMPPPSWRSGVPPHTRLQPRMPAQPTKVWWPDTSRGTQPRPPTPVPVPRPPRADNAVTIAVAVAALIAAFVFIIVLLVVASQ